jgi:hypothetical protein
MATPRLHAQGVVVAVCIAIAVLDCAACSIGGEAASTTKRGISNSVSHGWITYRDSVHRFSISYPPSWNRARELLTPNRAGPQHELVSVGTNRLVAMPRDLNCAQASARALRALGSTGALISLAVVSGASATTAPARPAQFRLTDGARGEAVACVSHPQFTERVISFSDGGRVFFYSVFLGKEASPETRVQATRVLNSLKTSR